VENTERERKRETKYTKTNFQMKIIAFTLRFIESSFFVAVGDDDGCYITFLFFFLVHRLAFVARGEFDLIRKRKRLGKEQQKSKKADDECFRMTAKGE
jgi:hypothetical protein